MKEPPGREAAGLALLTPTSLVQIDQDLGRPIDFLLALNPMHHRPAGMEESPFQPPQLFAMPLRYQGHILVGRRRKRKPPAVQSAEVVDSVAPFPQMGQQAA